MLAEHKYKIISTHIITNYTTHIVDFGKELPEVDQFGQWEALSEVA